MAEGGIIAKQHKHTTVEPKLVRRGKKLDSYELNTFLDGVEINVGSIHILRSIVETRDVTIRFTKTGEQDDGTTTEDKA